MMIVTEPSALAIERRIPADELALRRAGDGVADPLVGFLRDLPPEGRPERLAFDVGELDADGVERHLVDLEDGALGVEQSDELHHRVERDARDLLAVALAWIGGDDFRAAHRDRAAGFMGRHAVMAFFDPRWGLSTSRPRRPRDLIHGSNRPCDH